MPKYFKSFDEYFNDLSFQSDTMYMRYWNKTDFWAVCTDYSTSIPQSADNDYIDHIVSQVPISGKNDHHEYLNE